MRSEAYKLPPDAHRKGMSWSPPPPPPPPSGLTLVEAVQQRDANRVRLLLARGIDPNAERTHALCVAAADGSVGLMRMLLDAGADPAARGGLPLALAVDGGHLEAARLLLERGASPDALHGEALRLAEFYGRQDIAELLLQHGAAGAQGPPATLPSGDGRQNLRGAGDNKENELP